MKFSNSVLLAILASSTAVSAAPATADTGSTRTMVKRQDMNEILEIIEELKAIKVKRDSIPDGDEAMELERRADSVIGNLISAFLNSGIIGDVIQTLTTDPDLKNSILAIVKSALQAAIVQGPTLIKALFNSGLLSDIFNKILNDGDLRSALLDAGKALFSTAINLLGGAFGKGSAATTTTQAVVPVATTEAVVPAAATPAAAKRDDTEYLEERDLSDIISFVVNQIKSSGIVSNLINKFLADPTTAVNFLTSALKNGIVLGEDVYNWAKSSGILQQGISWLANSDNGIISTLGKFLSGALSSGAVSSSEFDNAGSTTVATTATAVAVAGNTAVAAATTPAAAAAAATGDLGFLSKYAQPGATTLYKAKRMVY